MDKEGGRRLGGGERGVCDRLQSSARTPRTGLPRLWRTEHLRAANTADGVQQHVLPSHAFVVQVDVQFVRMMKRFIPLAELRTHHQAHKASGGPLQHMALFTLKRLSVQPLTRGTTGRPLSPAHRSGDGSSCLLSDQTGAQSLPCVCPRLSCPCGRTYALSRPSLCTRGPAVLGTQ